MAKQEISLARSSKTRRGGSSAKTSSGRHEALADVGGSAPIVASAGVVHGGAGPKLDSLVEQRPRVRQRAFELLMAQPVTLAGLSQAERDAVVIIAVADDQGNGHPISRFGDSVWNMASAVEAKNRYPSTLTIAWPNDVPKAFVNDAKAVLYCALRRGRHGRRWSASAVARSGRQVGPTLRYLASLGLHDFSEVRPLHLSDHISELRQRLQPSSVRKRLEIVDLVWAFPMEVFHPLELHPWAGKVCVRPSHLEAGT